MMEESRCIAHWGSRPQPIADVGRQWAGFIADIGRLNPALSHWFTQGKKRYRLDKPVDLDAASLTARLEAGRHWSDATIEEPQRHVIEELGYHDLLVNNPDIDVTMKIQAGAYDLPKTLPLNSCYLEFRDPREDTTGIYDPDMALNLVKCQITHWNPDAVTWNCYPWLLLQEPLESRPVVGWINYFKNVHLTDVPIGRTIPFAEGTIIQTAPHYQDVTDHMITTLHHHLLTNGTLKPIR